MVRMLLMLPPLTPEGPVQPPVGVAALAAWLVKHRHHPHILDFDLFLRQSPSADWMSCLAELDYQLERLRPDVVGVTSMYSNSLHAGHLIARTRAIWPSALTVAGGSHFGALPREALERYPQLDFVIQGEGEGPLIALLDQCTTGRDWSRVPSLAWRRNGKIIVNTEGPLVDLSELPNPWTMSRTVLDVASYLATDLGAPAERVAYVEAGRGCPYACSFCSTAPFWRRRYRVKEAPQLVDEIEHLYEAGYTRFILVHDLLTANTRYITQVCDALLARRLPVKWMANSRTDISLDGLLPRMKAAGCWKLFFGIESAAQEMQQRINKGLLVADAFSMVIELGKHGLTSTCSFVIGHPDETRAQASRSIAAGARLKVLGAEIVQFHRLRIWPPAPLADEDFQQTFDSVSVAIEYPFLQVPDGDLDAIFGDPKFFTGYFPPESPVGSPEEIAQLEMFAHHAVGIAPMTLHVLESLRPGEIVDVLYASLKRLGPLSRADLDWDGGRIMKTWRAIQPYIAVSASLLNLNEEELALVTEVLAYEDRRASFAGNKEASHERRRLDFQIGVDVPELIRRIQEDAVLDSTLLRRTRIAFIRSPEGTFGCFAS